MKILDLFCGCGGFSLGAHQAGLETVLAIDIDKTLSSAYRLNFPNTVLENLDLSKTSSGALLSHCGHNSIDGIIGGPPCQGFSHMGHRRPSDPRNSLLRHFYSHVMNIQPKFFVMENVPGLLNSAANDDLEKLLNQASELYTIIGPLVVDAAQLGAPTKRKRVIVIGLDKHYFSDILEDEFTGQGLSLETNVKDAIWDLPDPIEEPGDGYGWRKLDLRRTVSSYANQSRKLPPKNLGWELAKEKLVRGQVSGFQSTSHTRKVIKRFSGVEQGNIDRISKAQRLNWDGLCPTLRSGTGSDKGSYQSVRPIHPEQDRVITVREAARLQGFPDWFVFHSTKWHSFRMIGNSVSPIMSQHILSTILSRLKSQSKAA